MILEKRFNERDWVGQWYLILKERGENDMVSMGRGTRNPDGTVTPHDVFSFSHSIMDGTSAVPYYLKQLGDKVDVRFTPFKRKLSLWQHIKLTLEQLTIAPKSRPIWKYKGEAHRPELHDYAKMCLSREETAKIKDFCKSKGISENTYLLYHFSQVVLDEVENPDDEMTILFPVNMRGIVTKKDINQNHSSFIPINISRNNDLDNLNQQLRSQLKSLAYIGIWWVHHLGVLFGVDLMRKLSKNASQKSFWVGTFSNVGDWETQDKSHYKSLGPDECWFFAAPGSANYPLGLILMTFNGQMGLSLKVHPSVAENTTEKGMEMLRKLRDNALSLKYH
jgi:hypothetical protein